MEILPKKGPLFREFGAQKPTHMGGTYPYPQHVMYPPPPPPPPGVRDGNDGDESELLGFLIWLRNSQRD